MGVASLATTSCLLNTILHYEICGEMAGLGAGAGKARISREHLVMLESKRVPTG